jgi:hypothetical protein
VLHPSTHEQSRLRRRGPSTYKLLA